jgi:hypothetical protein
MASLPKTSRTDLRFELTEKWMVKSDGQNMMVKVDGEFNGQNLMVKSDG